MLAMLGLLLALTTGAPADEPSVKALNNGATVVMVPVPGSRHVAMESFYDAGFFTEPKGLCQAAHLLEHLACYGQTAALPEGEWMKRLSERGIANAETLPTFVHFDAQAPADDLEWLLAAESGRLKSLQITPELVAREVPRVYSETDLVESQRQAPLIKHALMAAHQAWRFGEKRALIRGGLAEIPIERLRDFYAATYRPDRLTLVLVGGFEPVQAEALLSKHVAVVARPESVASPDPIDWSGLPAEQRVEWDCAVPCVVIAWPPPADAPSRLVLSAAVGQMATHLAADEAVAARTRLTFGSNPTWPVGGAGELPVFVWASLRPEADPHETARLLKDAIVRAAHAGLSQADRAMVLGYLASLNGPTPSAKSQVAAMVSSLRQRQGMAQERAEAMAVLQIALQTGMRQHLLRGISPDDLARAAAMNGEAVDAALVRGLSPDAARVLLLVPDAEHAPKTP